MYPPEEFVKLEGIVKDNGEDGDKVPVLTRPKPETCTSRVKPVNLSSKKETTTIVTKRKNWAPKLSEGPTQTATSCSTWKMRQEH